MFRRVHASLAQPTLPLPLPGFALPGPGRRQRSAAGAAGCTPAAVQAGGGHVAADECRTGAAADRSASRQPLTVQIRPPAEALLPSSALFPASTVHA
ncbi:hypothetical protein G6F63_016552 [Rhizopus arrhizus]|nr:hypothetical protein G6F63_016552 [Rhizopus arrhizus]